MSGGAGAGDSLGAGAARGRDWLLGAAPLAFVALLFGPRLLAAPGAVIGSSADDLFLQYVGYRDFGFAELRRGRLPLWNPHIFSGMPALGDIQHMLLYPPNVLFLVLPLPLALNAVVMLHLALGGFFTGWWVRRQGVSLLPSLAAGLLYLGGGATYSKVLAGHETAFCLFAWAPLLLRSVDGVIDTGRPGPALAGACAAALMILAGHPQYLFHFGCAAALYAALRLARTDRRTRKALLLGVAGLLAAGVSAVQIAAGVQAKAETVREGTVPFAYAASFSFPPENLLTLVSPFLLGGVGGEGYWGRWLLLEAQLFFGLTGFVMALTALSRKADRDRWLLAGAAALLVTLALGSYSPLFRFLYEYVPLFGFFRGHAKWAVPASLFLVLLAARGFEAFLANPARPRALPAALLGASCAFGAAAFLLAQPRRGLVGGWWHRLLTAMGRTGESFTLSPELLGQEGFLRATLGGVASSSLAAAATLALLAMLVAVVRRRPGIAWSVVALAVAEVFLFDASYLATFPVEAARRHDVAAALAGDPGDYRVHVLGHPDSAMSSGVLDIWGYDPFVPRRYAEFVAFSQGVPLDTPAAEIPIRRWDPLLSLLRTRYLIAPAAAGGLAVEGPFPHLPRALLVPAYRVVSGPRERVLDALRAPDFDPRRIVVLEEEPSFPAPAAGTPPGPGAAAAVRVVPVSTDEFTVEAVTPSPSLLLLTERYSPAWRAEALPGSSQQSYRVGCGDYVLQAIPLGAGTHRIRLRFAPPGLWYWGAVSLGTLLLIAVTGAVLRRRRALPH